MNDTPATTLARRRGYAWPRRVAYRVGDYLTESARIVALTSGVFVAVVLHGMRPRTWGRVARRELVRQCWQAGITALPTTMLAATFVGFFLVFQILFWLDAFGDLLKVSSLVIGNLVREIAPVSAALIVIGRSITVMIVDLIGMHASGQIRMLDSQGIDSFDYLVVPRVAALAICTWSLSMVFVVVTLTSGYLIGRLVDIAELSLFEFLTEVARTLSVKEFVLLPLKCLLLGAVIGCVAAVTVLDAPAPRPDVHRLLPNGYMRAVLATIVVSGTLTLLVTT